MRRVLIANRGEIALRIVRACRSLGLEAVAVYSRADQGSPHAWAADRAVCIGPPAATQSYLDVNALLHVAQATGADAIHPGYGFLAENADFAERCTAEGITFVGPDPEVIRLMGDKTAARRTARSLGVPVVPGSPEPYEDAKPAAEAARDIGFPLLLKARAGGGGRGMRVAGTEQDFARLFEQARSEAQSAFGDGGIYLERFFPRVRHVEVQVFGDLHGRVAHLWERDCSVQRRHQKLIEEAPSPVLGPDTRASLCESARKLAEGIGYVGAGTVEFIYDPDEEHFYFIEMNTRIQVEHPVTEAILGLDLVAEQLRVANGAPLGLGDGAPSADGHAIEFRVNAEDPARGFHPSPGTIERWRPPRGAGLRLDSHVYEGYRVPPFYDSMVAKLIVHGADRADTLARAGRALAGFRVDGVATTIPFHQAVLADEAFRHNRVHTRWVEDEFAAQLPGAA